ncbi:hypothetical protein ACIBG7_24700 [Nonomuraea sp. NPDC050328]|uniref:hypothetical protein n=1 Tax=Nonomuraea sp. NPDC050328 TaxID=3364361 RepID=UPI0037942676
MTVRRALAVLSCLAVTGCTGLTYDLDDVTRFHRPQNDGANVSVRDLHVRNVFLLGGEPGASPASELPLFAVIVNGGVEADRLTGVATEGGSVRLAVPGELPPGHVLGAGERPIGTASGLGAGEPVAMTFTFERAGRVRVLVPRKERAGHFTHLTPTPPTGGTPSPSAGETSGGTPSPVPSPSGPVASANPSPGG